MLSSLGRAFSNKFKTKLSFTDGKARIFNELDSPNPAKTLKFNGLLSSSLIGYTLFNWSNLSTPWIAGPLTLGSLIGFFTYKTGRNYSKKVISIDLLECGSKIEVSFRCFKDKSTINISDIVQTSELNSDFPSRYGLKIFKIKPKQYYWLNAKAVDPLFDELLDVVLTQGREVEIVQPIKK